LKEKNALQYLSFTYLRSIVASWMSFWKVSNSAAFSSTFFFKNKTNHNISHFLFINLCRWNSFDHHPRCFFYISNKLIMFHGDETVSFFWRKQWSFFWFWWLLWCRYGNSDNPDVNNLMKIILQLWWCGWQKDNHMII